MLNVNVNVNVKCKCKCSVYMSDLTTEHYNIYGNSQLSVTLQGIPCGQKRRCRPTVDIVEQCSLLNYDRHQTQIIPQQPDRDIQKKNYILGTCDPFTAPADICISITSQKSLPELQFGDIYIYLKENPSPYTPQKLKAYQKHRQ